MEILDLYDDNGTPLNETLKRGETPPKGKNIMLSIIFIKNSDCNYLIQKTSASKGNKYSTTGGHVIHKENGAMTIIRELNEELGIQVDPAEIKYIATCKLPDKQCIFNVYILEKDIELNCLKLQKEEVESVSWESREKIDDLICQNLFLKSHGYLFHKYIA